jgi:hypothetical protein
VLALDLEPGLIHAYQGEDGFADAHRRLTSEGFWLSNLDVKGTVRMRQSTLHWLRSAHPRLTQDILERGLRPSPGWCNARYLRTLNWLADKSDNARDYLLLWAFAVLDRQFGFALDTALEYERRFGPGHVAEAVTTESLRRIERRCRAGRAIAFCKKRLPSTVRRGAARLLRR